MNYENDIIIIKDFSLSRDYDHSNQKHYKKTKVRLTRTPTLRFSGRVNSSFCTSGTSRVNLVTNPVISCEWRKDKEVFTSGTYLWSFAIVTKIFHNGQTSHGGDHSIFKVMTSTLPRGTLGSVASLLAAILYQGKLDMNHKLCNIVSTERYIRSHHLKNVMDATMTCLTVMEYLCHNCKWPQICSTCKHFLLLSSFTTYYRIGNKTNTTGATSAEGTVYPSGEPECWSSC
jgi:hypothetical protein